MTLIPADRNNGESLNFRLFPSNRSETQDFFSQWTILPPSKAKLLYKKAEKTGTRQHISRWSEDLYSWEIHFSTSNFQVIPLLHSDSHCSPQQPSTEGSQRAPTLLPASRKQAWKGDFLKAPLKSLVLTMTTLGRCICHISLELPIPTQAPGCLPPDVCLCC